MNDDVSDPALDNTSSILAASFTFDCSASIETLDNLVEAEITEDTDALSAASKDAAPSRNFACMPMLASAIAPAAIDAVDPRVCTKSDVALDLCPSTRTDRAAKSDPSASVAIADTTVLELKSCFACDFCDGAGARVARAVVRACSF